MNDNPNQTLTPASQTQFVSDVNKFGEQTDQETATYKKVPVVYLPHKASFKPLPTPGLSSLIENAMSVEEVMKLVKTGVNDYKNASAKTLRKWKKIAEKRIEELNK